MPASLLPLLYRGALYGLLAVAIAGFGWVKGAAHVQIRWDLETADRNRIQAEHQVRVANRITTTVTRYIDRVRIIREAGETIIREVPVYVTEEADRRCLVPDGFVRLWNGANRGELPNPVPAPAGAADEAASAVVLSDIAAQHGREARQCRETEEQLINLQDALREIFAP